MEQQLVNKEHLEFNDIELRISLNINFGNNFTIILSAKANDLVDFGELLNVAGNLTINISNDTTLKANSSLTIDKFQDLNNNFNFYSQDFGQWNNFTIQYQSDSLAFYFNGQRVLIHMHLGIPLMVYPGLVIETCSHLILIILVVKLTMSNSGILLLLNLKSNLT